jgi:hypothetical protein
MLAPRLRTVTAVLVAAIALLSTAASALAAPAPLTLGMNDPDAFQGGLAPDQRAVALAHARDSGASIVRLGFSWAAIEPKAPSGSAQARDPGWAGYNWTETDAEVRAVAAAGMEPLLVLRIAPRWAEGPSRPSLRAAPGGTWKPDPAAFGDFARAIASRYSGSTTDAGGTLLPRVRYFQAWNEPNLSFDLMPQWQRVRGHPKASSPALYGGLLRAFYNGVKDVEPGDLVIGAGLAPYGDYPIGKGTRMPPLFFARRLFCIGRGAGAPGGCPRLPFDAFAVHSFPGDDPSKAPFNADDIRLKLTRITRVLDAAARGGVISRAQARGVWVTELAWTTKPDPSGVSLSAQARFLQRGLYLLWREGAAAALWYNLRDRGSAPFAATSGLFLRGSSVEADRPKPAVTAFRFPFIAFRSGRGAAVWGRAPDADASVAIEQRDAHGAWRTLTTFSSGPGQVFEATVAAGVGTVLRAVEGSNASLPAAVDRRSP